MEPLAPFTDAWDPLFREGAVKTCGVLGKLGNLDAVGDVNDGCLMEWTAREVEDEIRAQVSAWTELTSPKVLSLPSDAFRDKLFSLLPHITKAQQAELWERRRTLARAVDVEARVCFLSVKEFNAEVKRFGYADDEIVRLRRIRRRFKNKNYSARNRERGRKKRPAATQRAR